MHGVNLGSGVPQDCVALPTSSRQKGMEMVWEWYAPLPLIFYWQELVIGVPLTAISWTR